MSKTISVSNNGNTSDLSAFDFPYLKFLLVIWVVYVIIFLLCALFVRNKKNIVINLITGLGLISLGFTTGAIMGNNRNPISDTIMSSVFTLLGGIVVYMFAQNNSSNDHESKSQSSITVLANNENRLLVGLVLILFPLSLLYGGNVGARFRLENEYRDDIISYNKRLRLDTLEISRKFREEKIELDKNYNEIVYKTWSDNLKKMYEKKLSFLKKGDSVPKPPDYVTSK
jgi:hypothetical protein